MTDSPKRRSKQSKPLLKSIYTKPSSLLSRALFSKEKAESRHAAALKGWETRRAREAARWDQPDSTSDPTLPDDDLIRAIHTHASDFYTQTSLLLPPARQTRSRQWETKKRKLLEEEGLMTKLRWNSREEADSTWGHEGEVEDEEENEGESVGVNESDSLPDTSRRTAYKQRDMYRALDGSALLALGILVEKHIAKELERVGYAS